MKKSIKILSILMIAIMMFSVVTPVAFAKPVDTSSAIDQVDANINYDGDKTIATKIGNIIGFLQWIGAIAGVLIIAIFGIKYMMGSLEEKAEYKKTMIPFVVGAVVLILAPQIAKLVFSVITK